MKNRDLINNIAGNGWSKKSIRNDFIFGLLTIGGLALTYHVLYLHFELKKRVVNIDMQQAELKNDHQQITLDLQEHNSIVTYLQQEMMKIQTSLLTQVEPPARNQS